MLVLRDWIPVENLDWSLLSENHPPLFIGKNKDAYVVLVIKNTSIFTYN